MTDADLRRQLHETRAALLEEMTLTAKLRQLFERSDRQCGEAIQVAKDLRDLLRESQRRYDEMREMAMKHAAANDMLLKRLTQLEAKTQ